jgi:hypothetical protein
MRVGIDVVDRAPRFATVSALEKATHFNGNVDDVWILGMKGDAFDMRQVRWAGESPLLDTRHLAKSRQLGPAFAKIVAVKQMCRLGACV